jgi:hypothetical protein
MKTYGVLEVQLHSLTSALGGREWSTSRFRFFTTGETASDACQLGVWVSPTADLGGEMNKRIF